MLQNLKEYVRPENLEEAWNLYEQNEGKALFTSGGVSTALREDERTELLIDIQKLLPDSVIETDDLYEIGGGMHINEIIDDMETHHITQVLKTVATNQIRNMSTLSGSIAQKYGWSDIVTLFLSLKASLRVYDGTEHIIALEDYLHGKEKPVILSVLFDKRFNHGAFQHISKTDYDVSQLNFYLCAEIQDGIVKDTGAAYGARPGLAVRFETLETELNGKSVEVIRENLENISEIGLTAKVSSGFDLSEDYRKELMKVFIKRTLKLII